MDRTNLNIAPALRLLLVGGLFAMFWIIFGAGSAHAAPAPPPGESPHTATGLIPSLTAPVKPLITVQPPTEPAPPSSTATAPVPVPPATAPPSRGTVPASTPAPQATAPPTFPPTPSQGPLTALHEVTAPITDLTGNPTDPLTAPVTELVTGTVQPLVAPLTAPATQLVTGTVQPLLAPVTNLAGAAVAPLTAPATQLVTGTVQPLLAPVTNLAGAAVAPVTGLITGTTLAPVSIGPVSGIPGAAPAATATTNVAAVTASTSPAGADQSTAGESRPAAVRGAKAALSAVRSLLPTGITAGSAPRAAASMNDDGTSPQSPARLPSEELPATAPVPSPVSGSAGASGPVGAGAQAAADLSYRFVLPMTGGGEGSLFSFVLPGSTTQDPGFSPD
ncbi:hypothetical protein NG819_15675 [Pseudarthrobacter sp. Fe7]|nr:hypothetical protein NG819_15675 [Pseudarthrobacter sp. Fe7]